MTKGEARTARARATKPSAAPLTIKDLLSYRLHRTANTVSRSAAMRYRAEFNVSLGEWRSIALLGAEAPLSLNELARQAGLDKAQMSRVVTGLTDRGLVRRDVVPGAGRTVRLSLTRDGERIYAGLIAAARERDAMFLSCLTREEHRVLERALGKLAGLARSLVEGARDPDVG